MTNTPEGPEKAPEEKGNVVLRKNSLEGFKDTDGTENPSGDFIPYFPGREDVFQSLIRKYHFKTLKENETDKEAIFIYIEPEYKTEILSFSTKEQLKEIYSVLPSLTFLHLGELWQIQGPDARLA